MKTDGYLNIENNNSTRSHDNNHDKLTMRSCAESVVSTIPPSLFSTPRTTDEFLPNVDLTLNSNVKKSDIKTYLIEIFSKCKI